MRVNRLGIVFALAAAMALALAVSGCGDSSGDGGAVAVGSEGAPAGVAEETVATAAGADEGAVKEVPVADDAELIVDVSTGEPIGQFEIGRGHLYFAWSADGSVLVNPPSGTTLQVIRL